MGLTKEYFLTPVRVPYTLRRYLDGGGQPRAENHTLWFEIRRESQDEADDLAKATMLGDRPKSALEVERFCRLLASAPVGLEDFPQGEDAPLEERALQYFSDPCFAAMVRTVLNFYERAVYPSELFRGI